MSGVDEVVARARTARGELVLRRRAVAGSPAVLELRVNGVFVMDTQETSSEVALAEVALDLVEHPARVLVGGLGLGFTARRALADDRVERVVVAEIEAPLIEWMRTGVVPHGPALLADPRLEVVDADVANLATGPQTYDLVLLDVDNGPGHLVHETNAALYEADFLAAARRVIGPGGVLVVWSASPAPGLRAAMERVFGSCAERRYPVRLGQRSEEYLIYVSRR